MHLIDRGGLILKSNGQTTGQHEHVGRAGGLAYRFVKKCPISLRTCRQTMFFTKQHHALQIHAKIHPLAIAERAVDIGKQTDRRIKHLRIFCKLTAAFLFILARDAQHPVQILTNRLPALVIHIL